MRKINIGAGSRWRKEGWETLDYGPGDYQEPWQHFGNLWDSKLPSNTYGILFTAQTMEHVPHFKAERAIAEFNRIMQKGGILRILVPDLEKAAIAYVNRDMAFFRNTTSHRADHLGLGSCFLNKIISPGHQTVVVSKNFDEIIGSYAHTYSYDFEMMKILLEKWGFANVVQSEYGKSSVQELREKYSIVYNGKKYPGRDDSARMCLSEPNTYITGFDNKPNKSLFVEAIKKKMNPTLFLKSFIIQNETDSAKIKYIKSNHLALKLSINLSMIAHPYMGN